MNVHVVKWKNLIFICSKGVFKSFYAICPVFLHKFKQRLSYVAQVCEEKYTVLENASYIITCCRNGKVSALYHMKIH